jgi:osmotically-inducible protein OsmY
MVAECQKPITKNRLDNAGLARLAREVLKAHVALPHERIRVDARDGVLYLTGEVDNHYQKRCAGAALGSVKGARTVVNQLRIHRKLGSVTAIKRSLQRSLRQCPSLEPKQISVSIEGHTATLRGCVASFQEREEVEQIALATAGIYTVLNDIRCHDDMRS